MKITSIIAIYFIIWWLCLILVLPWGIRNAAETGDKVEAGHDAGAPVRPRLGRKAIYATVLATAVFASVYAVYMGGWISIGDTQFLVQPKP